MGEFLCTARQRQCVLVADGGACDFIKPVGVGTIFRRAHFGAVGVNHIVEFRSCKGLCTACHLAHGEQALICNLRAAFACAACGDDDDTVGASCTVDGRCRAVLEHVDALDVLRVDVADVGTGHTVDDYERSLASREGVGASEQDFIFGCGIGTRGVHDLQTGHLALEHTHCV